MLTWAGVSVHASASHDNGPELQSRRLQLQT